MTLRHVDSMALYGTDAEVTGSGKWTSAAGTGGNLLYRQAGRNTGAYAVKTSGVSNAALTHDFSSESWVGSNVGWVVGCAIKPVDNSVGQELLCLVNKTTNTSGIALKYTAATTISLVLGNGLGNNTWATAVATTTCSTSTWDYHEIKILPGGTAGAASRVIWKKNGVQVYDSGAGAVDIKTSTINELVFGTFTGSSAAFANYTDLYVCDTTGSNADFLGDTRIETLYPNGDGHRQDFTAGTPRNYLTADQWDVEGSFPYTSVTFSPFSTGGAISQSTDMAYSGANSVKIACTGGIAPPGAAITIPVKANTTYTIAWRAQISGAASLGTFFRGNQQDAAGNSLGAGNDPSSSPSYNSGVWTNDSYTFTTTSGCFFLRLAWGINGSTASRNLYLDQIGVYEGSSAFYVPPGAWGNVWELAEDGDTSYLRSGTDGAIQTFAMTNLNSVSGSVVGVVVNPYAKAENTGTRQLQPVFEGTGSTSGCAYVSASALTQTGDTSWAGTAATTNRITLPSNILEGDELFVLSFLNGTLSTGPSGFTQLDATTFGGWVVRLWHKTASSTDANNTISNAATTSVVNDLLFFAYRGGSYNTFSKATATAASGISTPTVTPTLASQLVQLVALAGVGNAPTSISAIPSITNDSSLNGHNNSYVLGNELVAGGVGGGNRAVTGTGGSDFAAYTISLTGVSYAVGSTASVGTLKSDLSFGLVPLIVESNPNTSAAWTISDVNAVEAGIKLA